MKKNPFVFASLFLAGFITACGDSNTTATTTTSTSADTLNTATNNNNNTAAGAAMNNKLPLSPADSTFVMKAATGGMMEVEAGNLAQQNAQSDRVKAFASMMVQDHQNANRELMSLASGRGMTVPGTLPPDVQSHVESMRKMQGRAFDKHYMGMMVNDHKKTIADFEQQANSGTDPELKAWAQKMLPALQMHRDSAVAINSAMK